MPPAALLLGSMTRATATPIAYRPMYRAPEPAPPFWTKVWFKLMVFLLAVVAGGWSYYHYVWQYRLPQERTLTTQEGKVLPVRLEARLGNLLKLTLLGDGTKELYPIALLSDEDQAFARKLARSALVLPLNYMLKDARGNAQSVSLLGRNDFLLQYKTTADQVMHYLPLTDLPTMERAVVDALPSGLTITCPFDYFFVDAAGNRTPVEILGRDAALVRYTVVADGSEHLAAVKLLPAVDQEVIESLPEQQITVKYPVDYTFKDAQGNAVAVKILGHSTDLVKYSLATDSNEQMKPLSKLTPVEQDFVNALPASLQDQFPLRWTRIDQAGKTLLVEITARSKDLFQYLVLGADEKTPTDDAAAVNDALTKGEAHYGLMSTLPDADQDLLRLYPDTLQITYPFSCTLTDSSGRSQQVSVLGQTRTTVKFSLLPDGKTYDYDVAKLAATDQAFLNTLPKTLKQEVAPPPLPPIVKTLFQTMIDDQKKIDQLNIDLASTDLPNEQKGFMQNLIGKDQAEITRNRAEIANNFNDRITALQQANVNLEERLVSGQISTDEKNTIKDQIEKNNQTIGALRDQFHSLQTADTLIGDELK